MSGVGESDIRMKQKMAKSNSLLPTKLLTQVYTSKLHIRVCSCIVAGGFSMGGLRFRIRSFWLDPKPLKIMDPDPKSCVVFKNVR